MNDTELRIQGFHGTSVTMSSIGFTCGFVKVDWLSGLRF